MAKNVTQLPIKLLVIGGSAGSLEVITKALPHLQNDLPFAIIIVLHRKSTADSSLTDLLSSKTELPLIEACDKEMIKPGHIYLAPADYHLLIEKDHTLSLDYSEKINYSRPSIDASFQTAAEAYSNSLACILLSGASVDGVEGLEYVQAMGGITAVQNPETAEVPYMPQKALDKIRIDFVIDHDKLIDFIRILAQWSLE